MIAFILAAILLAANPSPAGSGRGEQVAAPVQTGTGPSAPLVSTQTGTASWYGPGTGVAMPFCTWTLRTTQGCGSVAIQSLDTGITVIAPVIDYCQCYVGTPQERIVDLQWGVVDALGLDRSRGLYPVSVWPVDGTAPTIPDTAMEAS